MCSAYHFHAGISTNAWQRERKLLQVPYRSGFEDLRTTIFLGSPDCLKYLHSTACENCDIKAFGILHEEAQKLQMLQLHETLSGKLSSHSLFTAEEDLIDILLARDAILARLGMERISLADYNTGQAVGSWLRLYRRLPESVSCLLENRPRNKRHGVEGSRGGYSQR